MSRLAALELVVATRNRGKLAEFAQLLRPFGMTARGADELGLEEPVEDGTTFEENALKKAAHAAAQTGLPALADDSGLCVDALDGAPGVYSADWAQRPDGTRDFALAMRKVEDSLQARGVVSPEERRARFVALLCLAYPDGRAEYFRGEVPGTLVWPPRGDRGFGYDPIFLPDGESETFGEMAPERKQQLSHRARAFGAFARARLSVHR